MAKAEQGCFDEALEALKNFDADELRDYVQSVLKLAREKDHLGSVKAFEEAVNEINNERLQAYFERATGKANNTTKFEKMVGKIRSGAATVRQLLTKRYTNLGDNVASAQWSAKSRLARKAFDKLTEEEMSFLRDPKNQYIISDAMDGLKVDSPMASNIAKAFEEYIDYRNAEMIISNALYSDEINLDRNFRYIHDAEKIAAGGRSAITAARSEKKENMENAKPLWIENIKKDYDMYKTFKNTDAVDEDGKINWTKVDKILSNMFDNITTHKSEIITQSAVVNDREAVERRSRMFLVPKSMRNFVHYNKLYGKGDLYSAWVSDLNSAGAKIGTAELWGDSPANMYLDLRQATEDSNFKKNSAEFGTWWDNTDRYYKTVMGQDRAAVSASWANFGANLRTLTSMSRLIKISLQSTSDIGYIASFAQRMGIGYWRAYFNQLNHIFDRLPNEERTRIARLNKLAVDSHLGYMGRWIDAANSSELFSKASSAFFKRVGLEAFDRGNKVGIMHLMSKHLYENSGKAYGELNPSLQKWVSKFMTPAEWELLRKKSSGGLFTVENADALTNDELKAHQEANDSKTPLYQLRNDLYRKVDSMFQVASENAVLSPTDFERSWLFLGTNPGTIAGELTRTVMQFKSYTMAYIDRVLVQGWKDADTAQQKLVWATQMMMGTLPLSVASIYFDNLTNGLSMPDWSQMNVPEREKYLVSLVQPSLAIFSGMLDPRNQNSGLVMSFIKSPTVSLINNLLGSAGAMVDGDPKRSAKQLKKVAENMLPIQNTPIFSPFIREAFGDQAYLEPGQRILYGA